MKEIATLFALLYVLSSGPTLPLALELRHETFRDGGREVIEDTLLVSPWWRTIYAPLIWESNQPSGSWLGLYWNLFPSPDA